LKRQSVRKKHDGMGFLSFKEVKSVSNLLESLHNAEIHGRKLQIKAESDL